MLMASVGLEPEGVKLVLGASDAAACGETPRRATRTGYGWSPRTFRTAMIEMPCQLIRSDGRLIYRLISWTTVARDIPASGRATCTVLWLC